MDILVIIGIPVFSQPISGLYIKTPGKIIPITNRDEGSVCYFLGLVSFNMGTGP